MPFTDEGSWKYNLGGRDYIISWKHPSGQEVEMEPCEDNDPLDFDKMQWDVEWRTDKGDQVQLGTGSEGEAQDIARAFMRCFPEGAKTFDDAVRFMMRRD
jgi:hypothetical protein